MKTITSVYSAPHGHWVGDGFPMRSLFTYDRMGAEHITPFLMLDYAGPHDFEPAAQPRGVGQHPHRGFETVTIVYDGELTHKDSAGGGGTIARGDVQWMTAGAGVIHEEFHSQAFTSSGGRFEVVQLWVNLPAADKSAQPRYQSIEAADIPRVALADEAGHISVIAGDCAGTRGPASTFTPINVWDLRLQRAGTTSIGVPEGHNTMVVVLSGAVTINNAKTLSDADLALIGRDGNTIRLQAVADNKLLLLSSDPIDEPVVGYGPFVMNSSAEIHQAFADYQAGKYSKAS